MTAQTGWSGPDECGIYPRTAYVAHGGFNSGSTAGGRLSRIDLDSGTITELSLPGMHSLTGLAVRNGLLYASTSDNTLVAITLDGLALGSSVFAVAGGGSVVVNDLASAPDGSLFCAARIDGVNYIAALSTSGTIIPFFQNGVAGTGGGTLAIDRDSNFHVGATNASQRLVYDRFGTLTAVRVIAADGLLGFGYDPVEDVFYGSECCGASGTGEAVFEFSPLGTGIELFDFNDGRRIQDIAVVPPPPPDTIGYMVHGGFTAGEPFGGTLATWDQSTGLVSSLGLPTGSGMTGVAFAEGVLWAITDTRELASIDIAGNLLSRIPLIGLVPNSLDRVYDLTADEEGTLYGAALIEGNHSVVEVAKSGQLIVRADHSVAAAGNNHGTLASRDGLLILAAANDDELVGRNLQTGTTTIFNSTLPTNGFLGMGYDPGTGDLVASECCGQPELGEVVYRIPADNNPVLFNDYNDGRRIQDITFGAKAPAPGANQPNTAGLNLYWSGFGGTWTAPADGSGAPSLLYAENGSIAIDAATGDLFWADNDVFKGATNGLAPRTLLYDTGFENATDLVIDPDDRLVVSFSSDGLWTGFGDGSGSLTPLYGAAAGIIFNSNTPRDVEYDQASDSLYWHNAFGDAIYAAAGDGSGGGQLYSNDAPGSVQDFVIVDNALYWVTENALFTAPCSGAGPVLRLLQTPNTGFRSITHLDGRLYLGEFLNPPGVGPNVQIISTTALDGSAYAVLYQGGLGDVEDLIVGPTPAARLCADSNTDGTVNPADFNAWIAAFNANSLLSDVNSDNLLTPADFNAWIVAFNLGSNGPTCTP